MAPCSIGWENLCIRAGLESRATCMVQMVVRRSRGSRLTARHRESLFFSAQANSLGFYLSGAQDGTGGHRQTVRTGATSAQIGSMHRLVRLYKGIMGMMGLGILYLLVVDMREGAAADALIDMMISYRARHLFAFVHLVFTRGSRVDSSLGAPWCARSQGPRPRSLVT